MAAVEANSCHRKKFCFITEYFEERSGNMLSTKKKNVQGVEMECERERKAGSG